MANNEEDTYLVIPQNYQNSFNLLGSISLKYINFIQALLCGGVAIFIYFMILCFFLRVWVKIWFRLCSGKEC